LTGSPTERGRGLLRRGGKKRWVVRGAGAWGVTEGALAMTKKEDLPSKKM